MNNQRIELLVIDPQADFHDLPGSTLAVPGSMDDAARLAKLIERISPAIDDIHVTLDTHQMVDIAHPIMWVDSRGRHPAPFTQISREEVEQGAWRTYNPAFQKRALDYVRQLEANNRYALVIWPPHTLVGTPGHNVVDPIMAAFADWENSQFARVDYVTKGHNPWTEHYSAVQADVPDPKDATTQLNTALIDTLQQADVVLLSGQALSHCVANTVIDIADNFGDENVRKLVLIEDTSSSVPGFEALGNEFVARMKDRGMQTAKAAEIAV